MALILLAYMLVSYTVSIWRHFVFQNPEQTAQSQEFRIRAKYSVVIHKNELKASLILIYQFQHSIKCPQISKLNFINLHTVKQAKRNSSTVTIVLVKIPSCILNHTIIDCLIEPNNATLIQLSLY